MMAKTVKGRTGAETFDGFLAEQGLLAEAEGVAISQVLAWQIAEGMTKTVIATATKTDRRQLDRLLDPENKSMTLSTLRCAATALGRKLYVEIGLGGRESCRLSISSSFTIETSQTNVLFNSGKYLALRERIEPVPNSPNKIYSNASRTQRQSS
jgi:antitoxin HicB